MPATSKSPQDPPRQPTGRAVAWLIPAAAAAIILSLIALGVTSLVIANRAASLDREIAERFEPAQTAVHALAISLANQAVAVRSYLLTGRAEAGAEYAAARLREEKFMESVHRHAATLGPAVSRLTAQLESVLREWHLQHDRLLAEAAGELPVADEIATLDRLYRVARDVAWMLESEIGRMARTRRSAIQASMRLDLLISFALASAALVAGVLVALSAWRNRRLTVQLDARAQREAALRRVAIEVSEAASMHEVVDRLAAAAPAAVGAAGGYVEAIDRERREVAVVAVGGTGAPGVGTREPYESSAARAAIAETRPVVLDPVAWRARGIGGYVAARRDDVAVVATPISVEGRPFGALVLLWPWRRTGAANLDPRGVTVLSSLASLALTRRRTEQAVREREDWFRSIFDGSAIGISIMDVDGRILSGNRSLQRLLGFTAEELRGRVFTEVTHPADREADWKLFEELVAMQRERYELDKRLIRKDGSTVEVRLTASLVRNRTGRPRFSVGMVEDITERRRAERQIQDLLWREREARSEAERRRKELERLTEAKSRLMRGLSHDLKNPLAAADGYAQLLETGVRGELAPPQRESVARIRRSIQAAVSLIDDLMELARAERGAVPITRVPTEIGGIVTGAVDEYRAAAEAAGLSVAVRIPPSLPPIRTDGARVRQILGNLLSNAVKYTPPGGRVEVNVRVRRERRDGGRWLDVNIRDTGPGIPLDMHEQIFDEFYRLEPRARRGTGLGLAIGRRVARLLDGDITVRSRPGAGSTFTLRLPADDAG